MKLQKAVNGHREVLHSAYGASWVICDPIDSPGESAKGRCWVTMDIGDGLGEVGGDGSVFEGDAPTFPGR